MIKNVDIKEVLAENTRLTAEVRDLREQVQLLMDKKYGRKSETLNPNQLHLFANGKTEEDVALELPQEDQSKAKLKPVKKRKGNGRVPFPEHLTRERVEVEVAECDRGCPDCGETMQHIGTEITERGEIIPAKIVVKQYAQHRYACKNGHAVITAKAPAGVVDRAKYEASVYAHIVTKKYCDHVPLHRLEGIFKRQGFRIPKQTMWDMVYRVGELFEPIVKEMKAQVLAAEYIQADETILKVAIGSPKGLKQGYLWAYKDKDRVIFDYTEGRSRAGPTTFLGDYKGIFQTDGYPGYNEICDKNDLKHGGCWAHARRKFRDALIGSKREASECLIHINRLFQIERLLKEKRDKEGLSPEEFLEIRAKVRTRFSKRVLLRLMACLYRIDLEGRQSNKALLSKAMTYLANQKAPLALFLKEPLLEIDNNAVERDMKHIAVGRKNWLFAGSAKGAKAAALLFTLIASCKAMKIDPEAYIKDVLSRLDTTPAKDVAKLTPWAWAGENSDN